MSSPGIGRFHRDRICTAGLPVKNLRLRDGPAVPPRAESHVDRSITGAADFIQTNVVGTFTLLEAARDWLARAQAAAIYIFVNDFAEAIYFIRGTDADGTLLNGRYNYTMRFEKEQLPPVDRARGGFWSLTMYDKDYFMVPAANGRHNIGTVNLNADELKFGDDGSLTLMLSSEEPEDEATRANWLPAPRDQIALIVRTYVPIALLLEGSYRLPDVRRGL